MAETGEAAFPGGIYPKGAEDDQGNDIEGLPVNPGMDLRDWFAGQVLLGIWASATEEYHYGTFEGRAKDAYLMADAMLTERNGGA